MHIMRRVGITKAWRMFLVLAMIAMSLASIPVAMAATTVTIANGDVTSLVNAINTANSSGTPTVIELASGGDYVLTTAYYDSYTGSNYSGLPEMTGNFTIHGNGSTIERSPTAPAFGNLDVAPGGTLNIDNVTITGGNNTTYYKFGGGIFNAGTLTVTNSTITGNTAPYGGGGIYNFHGTLTVTGSTISNNTSPAPYTEANSAGGGINNSGGTATISNSTVTGNSTGWGGGGIHNVGGTTTAVNSTIVDNSTAFFGGGIEGYSSGSVIVTNSIVANNSSTYVPSGANIYDFVTDGGHNEIGTDANLGSLADNGGPTQTIALLPGSPAIDAGDDTICSAAPVNGVDQRGYLRPSGSHCDIGAFESGALAPVVPAFTFDLSSLPAKTYGDPDFDVSSYATKPLDDAGAITFALGSGSVGCSVTSVGVVTLTGATSGVEQCIIEASLAASGVYLAEGPISQSFSIAQATMCAPGSYSATSFEPCTLADAGSFVTVSGATSETACPIGTYQPLTGQTSCLDAPAGSYVDQVGAVTATLCPVGTYQPYLGQISCLDAPAGTYVDQSGSMAATPCAPGTYQPDLGQTSCLLAPAGSYVDQSGATAAILCSPGSYQPDSGQTSCLLAPVNTYVDTSGAVAPTACPTGTYQPLTGQTSCIDQTIPVITWSDPADITYGTALSSTQLNATADVPGTFVYTPANGTVLDAGNGQTLSVEFTPDDTTSYASTTATVHINVNQAAQTISFGALANKVVGDPAFSVSANGGASGNPVTFNAGPSGVCSSSGTNGSTISIDGAGTCTVTANQAGSTNYSAALDVEQSFDITNPVSNVAPAVTISSPAIGSVVPAPYSATLTAPFTDAGDIGTHTCNVSWGDGGSTLLAVDAADPSVCGATHSYAAAGVYTIQVTVTDQSNLSGSTSVMLVVYDPSAGFVTGGGWINSPAGAYAADPNMTGVATFGFVSKYKKGATVPTGTTQFQFDAAGFSFASDSYQWLVVNQSGTNAQFKGTGTINGTGSYTFMIWAGDASPDTFRIQITDDNNNGAIVYDNGTDQAIGGGQIIVHTSKK